MGFAAVGARLCRELPVTCRDGPGVARCGAARGDAHVAALCTENRGVSIRTVCNICENGEVTPVTTNTTYAVLDCFIYDVPVYSAGERRVTIYVLMSSSYAVPFLK